LKGGHGAYKRIVCLLPLKTFFQIISTHLKKLIHWYVQDVRYIFLRNYETIFKSAGDIGIYYINFYKGKIENKILKDSSQ